MGEQAWTTGERKSGEATRGQTEPLAALVSIAAICAALSLYAGVTTDVISDSGDERDVAEATMNGLWADIHEDGVFDPEVASLGEAVKVQSLPEGQSVRATVTVVGENGRLRTVDRATFGQDGKPGRRAEPPESATTVSRSVPVRVDIGDVRPGRLTVVVWE